MNQKLYAIFVIIVKITLIKKYCTNVYHVTKIYVLYVILNMINSILQSIMIKKIMYVICIMNHLFHIVKNVEKIYVFNVEKNIIIIESYLIQIL